MFPFRIDIVNATATYQCLYSQKQNLSPLLFASNHVVVRVYHDQCAVVSSCKLFTNLIQANSAHAPLQMMLCFGSVVLRRQIQFSQIGLVQEVSPI